MIERSEARDAVLRVLPALAARDGWNGATLRAAVMATGTDPALTDSLFPAGPAGAVEAWIDLADRDMADAATRLDIAAMRIPDRIRALVVLRFQQATPDKAAVRRGLSLLALPPNLPVAARTVARTADAMWRAAGDRSADFSWYTRRATLAAVYGATLAFWLRDDDPDFVATAAFLDRLLAAQGRLGKRLRPRR